MDDDSRIETHPDLMNPDWRKHAERDAWLGSKQERKQFRKQQKRAGRRPQSRKRRGLIAFLVILAATTAVIVYIGRKPGNGDSLTAAPTSINPTSVPDYATVDLAHPYAHTPAEVWKKGIDGITSPPAAAIGPFKADAVADAYAKVKQVIVAGRLDPALLFQHDTKAYVGLFAPDMRDHLTGVLNAKPEPGKPDRSSYTTQIAEGYHLLEQGPRSLGTLSARAGDKPGELVVDAKFVIGYAFDDTHPAELTGPSDFVSFLRANETYVVRSGDSFAASSRGLWLNGGEGSLIDAVGCAAAKDGYLAPAFSNPQTLAPGNKRQEIPGGAYDPSLPFPQVHDGCPPN